MAALANASQNSTTRRRRSVHQRSFLFSGTVLDNIRFGRPDATRDEVDAAARAVGADQIIAGLPDGYDTPVRRAGGAAGGRGAPAGRLRPGLDRRPGPAPAGRGD